MTGANGSVGWVGMLDWLARMRRAGPVHHDERTGQWHVVAHDEAQQVLLDTTTFSSDFSEMIPPQPELAAFAKSNFVGMDDPRHHQLRRLVTQAFTRRAVERLEPRVTAITHDLLDQVGDAPEFDLVEHLAHPLPVIVVAELLGIPTADLATFRVWADALLSTASGDGGYASDVAVVADSGPVLAEMADYLRAHVRERRRRPAEDLTSSLVAAETDGERLDEDEIVGVAALLLIAGHITTTAALCTGVVILDGDPAAASELRACPELLPAAVEEVLRFGSPFTQTYRKARYTADVAGLRIAAGEIVTVWLASANRDGSLFTDPDTFDVHRSHNLHLSFGHGAHFCLGAPLARMELRVALSILLARYPCLTLVRDARTPAFAAIGAVAPRSLVVRVAVTG